MQYGNPQFSLNLSSQLRIFRGNLRRDGLMTAWQTSLSNFLDIIHVLELPITPATLPSKQLTLWWSSSNSRRRGTRTFLSFRHTFVHPLSFLAPIFSRPIFHFLSLRRRFAISPLCEHSQGRFRHPHLLVAWSRCRFPCGIQDGLERCSDNFKSLHRGAGGLIHDENVECFVSVWLVFIFKWTVDRESLKQLIVGTQKKPPKLKH
jgi:hypothetical protein